MTAAYQQVLDLATGEVSTTVLRVADATYIPAVPPGRDRQQYEAWLAAGNTPDPPPYRPPAAPTGPAPDDALTEAQRANTRLDAGVQAAQDVMNQPPSFFATATTTISDPPTQADVMALQAQLDKLQAAMRAMLTAHGLP